MEVIFGATWLHHIQVVVGGDGVTGGPGPTVFLGLRRRERVRAYVCARVRACARACIHACTMSRADGMYSLTLSSLAAPTSGAQMGVSLAYACKQGGPCKWAARYVYTHTHT